MAFDAHKNFAYGTVLTAPSPATSGTSVVLNSGQGAAFPAVSFNATIWPAGVQPTTANSEIVRVTAISTDTFTITRTQESTSARTVIVGDQIAAGMTVKNLTDVEAGSNGIRSATTTVDTSAATAPSSGQVLTATASTTATWQTPSSGAMTLIGAAKGTNTSTSANTVSSFAISGLTQLDTIVIYLNCRQITQDNNNGIAIYSSTDATNIGRLPADGAMTTGQVMAATITIRCDQNSTTTYNMFTNGALNPGNSTTGTTSALTNISDKGMTTAWTGSWTIALHSDGMTSGGTLRYNWSVFKVAGQ